MYIRGVCIFVTYTSLKTINSNTIATWLRGSSNQAVLRVYISKSQVPWQNPLYSINTQVSIRNIHFQMYTYCLPLAVHSRQTACLRKMLRVCKQPLTIKLLGYRYKDSSPPSILLKLHCSPHRITPNRIHKLSQFMYVTKYRY